MRVYKPSRHNNHDVPPPTPVITHTHLNQTTTELIQGLTDSSRAKVSMNPMRVYNLPRHICSDRDYPTGWQWSRTAVSGFAGVSASGVEVGWGE